MPAVAGGDDHGVDVRAREQVAQVPVSRTILVPIGVVHGRLPGLAPALLDVADRDHLHVGLGQETPEQSLPHRAASEPDGPQDDPLASGGPSLAAQGSRRDREGSAMAPVHPKNRRRVIRGLFLFKSRPA